MKQPVATDVPNILYSCYTQKGRELEAFVPEHVICHVLAGELVFDQGYREQVFTAGATFLVRRNQLARVTKYPPIGGKFESVSIFLDQALLRGMATAKGWKAGAAYQGESLLSLPTGWFNGLLESLQPYLQEDHPLPAELSLQKAEEAVMLLLEQLPELQKLLLDFHAPGRTDLEFFMQRHFTFNVEIPRFAYLTGRSLATFKRDFQKVFHTSPNRWLQRKRLEEARHRIVQENKKPSEVYLDVGFENLSHFSFAFKKAFGVAPSQLA